MKYITTLRAWIIHEKDFNNPISTFALGKKTLNLPPKMHLDKHNYGNAHSFKHTKKAPPCPLISIVSRHSFPLDKNKTASISFFLFDLSLSLFLNKNWNTSLCSWPN